MGQPKLEKERAEYMKMASGMYENWANGEGSMLGRVSMKLRTK